MISLLGRGSFLVAAGYVRALEAIGLRPGAADSAKEMADARQ